MDGELRDALFRFVQTKFIGIQNVAVLTDDIVQNVYLYLRSSKSYTPDKKTTGSA